MKTNAQFDEAWRDLIKARRSEDINAVHAAAERVAHASRMLQLEQSDCIDRGIGQHETTPFDKPASTLNVAQQIKDFDKLKNKPKEWHEKL